MTIYRERVELLPLTKRMAVLGIVVILVLIVWYAAQRPTLEWTISNLLFLGSFLVIPLAILVNQIFASHLIIELTGGELKLRAGLSRQWVALGSIVSAKALEEEQVEPVSFWLLLGYPSLLSCVVPSRVEVRTSDNDIVLFSSRQPERLVSLIKRARKQASSAP